MGIIEMIFGGLLGGGRNVIKETAEVFRVNADAGDQRAHSLQTATLQQFAAEFAHARRGMFDRFIDAVNRVPRPAMALGVLALFGASLYDPIWFGERMQGLALVPEPLWWLLGAIVSFYFGARHQAKGQEFQRSIAATMAAAPVAVANIRELQALGADPDDTTPGVADTRTDANLTLAVTETTDNPALVEWRDTALKP